MNPALSDRLLPEKMLPEKRLSKRLLKVSALGCRPYAGVWQAMKTFVDQRHPATPDEAWVLQHPPVFTLGQAGKSEHLLEPGTIPVIHTDRGGQVTYHGPGQLVVYLLLDLKRMGINIREMVSGIEGAVVGLLDDYGLCGQSNPAAPGVYVAGAKVAALGLRVRRGYSYHGLSLNVDMDLSPFRRINPCGYVGLQVTDLKSLGIDTSAGTFADRLAGQLIDQLADKFGYDDVSRRQGMAGN